MKYYPWLILVAGMLAESTTARANTVLIGGTTRNGNFDADTSSTDIRTFADTPNWYNLANVANPQNRRATRTNNEAPSPGGFRNAALNLNGNRIFGNETGYTMQQGDVFSLSYLWRDTGSNWNDDADQIRVDLFYTDDDTLTGTQTVIATHYSGYSTTNATWEAVTANRFYTAAGGAVGKKLFVQFRGWPGDSNDDLGYARLDNFELLLVPEPAGALALLAGGAWGWLVRRRRFSPPRANPRKPVDAERAGGLIFRRGWWL